MLYISVRCFYCDKRSHDAKKKAFDLAAVISLILNAILGFEKNRSINQLGKTTEKYFWRLYALVFPTFYAIHYFQEKHRKCEHLKWTFHF